MHTPTALTLPAHRAPRARAFIAMALAVLLAGCAAVSKVNTGEVVLKNRLVVNVDGAWNQFERGMADNTPTWTVEGITVDAVQFYVALRDGEPIAPTPTGAKAAAPLAFKASMQPAEVATLFQALWTRDGSSFKLEKIAPAAFAGGNGFRFEYELVRKVDEVRLRGVAWGVVRNKELFLINYMAPRLSFFDRHLKRVEALAASAKVRG